MSVSSPELQGLCCEIADALTVAAPRGWAQATVALERRGGQLRVEGIDARLDAPPRPMPALGMDEAGRIGGMSAAFTDLLHLLHREGVEWDGARAAVTRGADRLAVTLLNRDGRPATSVSVDRAHLDALFLAEPFLAALAEAEGAIRERDARTAQRLEGVTSWRYAQPERRATFEVAGREALQIPAQILGTWSADDETWLWGWANTAVEPGCTQQVEDALKPDARESGMAALWRERYPCEEGFADVVAKLAAHRMGAEGVFRGRAGGAWLYLALMG